MSAWGLVTAPVFVRPRVQMSSPIDKKILEMSRAAVGQKLGKLEDLPPELANTVANVFYKYFELTTRWRQHTLGSCKSTSSEQAESGKDLDDASIGAMDAVLLHYAKTREDQESLHRMREASLKTGRVAAAVIALRKIDRQREPGRYDDRVKHILDGFKYRIENAEKKSFIARTIERDLNLGDIDEIPELYRLL
jgi:hypothetical protein